MIQTFPNTAEGEAQAFAVPAPREISNEIENGERIWRVRTGADMQEQPQACPPEATPGRFRRALTQLGHREAVEAVIAQAGQTAQDMWEYEPTIRRAHPLVAQLGAAAGMTPEQIDAVFSLAATL